MNYIISCINSCYNTNKTTITFNDGDIVTFDTIDNAIYTYKKSDRISPQLIRKIYHPTRQAIDKDIMIECFILDTKQFDVLEDIKILFKFDKNTPISDCLKSTDVCLGTKVCLTNNDNMILNTNIRNIISMSKARNRDRFVFDHNKRAMVVSLDLSFMVKNINVAGLGSSLYVTLLHTDEIYKKVMECDLECIVMKSLGKLRKQLTNTICSSVPSYQNVIFPDTERITHIKRDNTMRFRAKIDHNVEYFMVCASSKTDEHILPELLPIITHLKFYDKDDKVVKELNVNDAIMATYDTFRSYIFINNDKKVYIFPNAESDIIKMSMNDESNYVMDVDCDITDNTMDNNTIENNTSFWVDVHMSLTPIPVDIHICRYTKGYMRYGDGVIKAV